MTDKEIFEKLVAEIERRYNEKDRCGDDIRANVYKSLLSFIDTTQKEPKKRNATGKLKECIDNITDESLAKARKQLQEEPKECMYARDNYTDEDRKVLCDGCEEKCAYAIAGVISTNAHVKKEPVSEDLEQASFDNAQKNYKEGFRGAAMQAFNEGVLWQKQKDAEAINENALLYSARLEGVEIGKAEMKQKMKDAVTAEVRTVEDFMGTTTFRCVCDKYKVGDKVKLIIIKED